MVAFSKHIHNDLPVVPNAHPRGEFSAGPVSFSVHCLLAKWLVRHFFRSGTTSIFVQLDTVERIFATGQSGLKLDVKKLVRFARTRTSALSLRKLTWKIVAHRKSRNACFFKLQLDKCSVFFLLGIELKVSVRL